MNDSFLNGVRVAKVLGMAKEGVPLGRVLAMGGDAIEIRQRLVRAGVELAYTDNAETPDFLLDCALNLEDMKLVGIDKYIELLPKLKRGLIGVCVTEEWPMSLWREKIPTQYDIVEDTERGWTESTRNPYLKSILFIAPSVYPVRRDLRYAGIERLVALLSYEMAARGYTVYVVAPSDSAIHPKAWLADIGRGHTSMGDSEEEASYAGAKMILEREKIDVVHDFSHRHLIMRRHKVPGVAMIWHDPKIMTPPEPGYNVATISQWQADRFRETTKQEARAMDVVCADADFYGHYFEKYGKELGKAFTTMGKMGPTKGNLKVAQMCLEAGVGLDVIGGLGSGDEQSYVERILELQRNGDAPVTYRGEVSEEAKAFLLATSRGLLYAPDFGPGMGESHIHKAIDAGMAGCPTLVLDRGAYREVMEEGTSALFASDLRDMRTKLPDLEKLDRAKVRQWAIERYSVQSVADRWVPWYEELQGWHSWQ